MVTRNRMLTKESQMISKGSIKKVTAGLTIAVIAAFALSISSGPPVFFGSTVVSAADASFDSSELPPRDEWAVPDDGNWMKSEQLQDEVIASFVALDGTLTYPNETSKERARNSHFNATYDKYGLFEDGLQDSLVIDVWTCEWAGFARESSIAGDKEGVISAGHQLIGMIDLPGQRAQWENWDQMAEAMIEPLLAGDYESVQEDWEFQCSLLSADENGGL